MKNLSTKVKSMKIRFLTFVEKLVPTSLQTLLPYFVTIQFVEIVFVSHYETIMGSGSLNSN